MQNSLTLTKRQKQALKAIYTSIRDFGYPPTLADLCEKLGVSSNQAVLDLLKILENKGYIKKEEGAARGIKILQKGFEALSKNPILPNIGISAAGPYRDAFDTLEWKEQEGLKTADNVFITEVVGDSMLGIGLEDGDNVLVQESKEFKNGDTVLARDIDGRTIKTLVRVDGKTYLKPENPKYPNIPIYPETRLIGKVIGKIGGKR